MDIVRVPEGRVSEFFKEFYSSSVFTFEGIDTSDKAGMKAMEKLFRETGFTQKDLLCYKYSGKDMNKAFNLTGENAYPEDLTFLSIPNYYNPMVKLECGARWFDDIVDNNAIKQNGIRFGIEPDFG